MHVESVSVKGTWREVADSARTTIGMGLGKNEPPPAWKRRMLLSEHSPIRQISIRWKWVNLKYWVSVHFVRHKLGIEHFVSTQRTDHIGQISEVSRDDMPQAALVSHECLASTQAMITVSRKRLCTLAGVETRAAWQALLTKLKDIEPELVSVCVRECLYRGFCPERKPCGYSGTPDFQQQLALYRGP